MCGVHRSSVSMPRNLFDEHQRDVILTLGLQFELAGRLGWLLTKKPTKSILRDLS